MGLSVLYTRFDVGREIVKWIAILTMTIDHIGAIFFPEIIVFRIIGRLAFPIFCYLLVLGVESTRNARQYFVRLLIFAFISQVPFYLAFGYEPWESLNIFFTLALGLITLVVPFRILPPFVLGLFVFMLLFSVFLNIDYDIYGVVSILCMRILKKNTKFGIVLLVLLNVLSLTASNIQILSLLALPLILYYQNGRVKVGHEVNTNVSYPIWRKYFFYIYYPLHLSILYLIKSSLF